MLVYVLVKNPVPAAPRRPTGRSAPRLTQVLDALLPGNGLFGALAGTGVRLGALTADRKPLAVADPPIATDFTKTLNVLVDLAAQLTFNSVVVVEKNGQFGNFFFFEVFGAGQRVNTGFTAEFSRDTRTAPKTVKTDVVPVLAWIWAGGAFLMICY